MKTQNIQSKVDEIVSHFAGLNSWEDKYKEIINLGKGLKAMPEELIVDAHKVKGCQSQVWLFPEMSSPVDNLIFYADSDALIAKGLVALVLKVCNGSTADEIVGLTTQFIEDIGLKEHLSPNRSNGILAMFKQIKLYAFAIKMKAQ